MTDKYAPLRDLLNRTVGVTDLVLDFDALDALVGGLPPSARHYAAWWGNQVAQRGQSRAWMSAGWRVAAVNLTNETVRFSRSTTVKSSGSREPGAPVVAEPNSHPPFDVGGPALWNGVVAEIRSLIDSGLRHLLTEDVLRFAVIQSMIHQGVAPNRLITESYLEAAGGPVDLVVDNPPFLRHRVQVPTSAPDGCNADDSDRRFLASGRLPSRRGGWGGRIHRADPRTGRRESDQEAAGVRMGVVTR